MVPPSKVKGPRTRILLDATLETRRTVTNDAVMSERYLNGVGGIVFSNHVWNDRDYGGATYRLSLNFCASAHGVPSCAASMACASSLVSIHSPRGGGHQPRESRPHRLRGAEHGKHPAVMRQVGEKYEDRARHQWRCNGADEEAQARGVGEVLEEGEFPDGAGGERSVFFLPDEISHALVIHADALDCGGERECDGGKTEDHAREEHAVDFYQVFHAKRPVRGEDEDGKENLGPRGELAPCESRAAERRELGRFRKHIVGGGGEDLADAGCHGFQRMGDGTDDDERFNDRLRDRGAFVRVVRNDAFDDVVDGEGIELLVQIRNERELFLGRSLVRLVNQHETFEGKAVREDDGDARIEVFPVPARFVAVRFGDMRLLLAPEEYGEPGEDHAVLGTHRDRVDGVENDLRGLFGRADADRLIA